METIKVIDLLNKIANGEEVPEKIKYITTNYIYDSDNQIYYKENYQDIGNYSDLLMELSSHKGIVALNDEIEIIEDTPKVQVEMTQEEYFKYLDKKLDTSKEDKKIKRIQSNGESLYSEYIGEWLIHKERYTEYDELLMNKINEIIDKVNGE